MSREIKFRIWDKTCKKMVKVRSIDFDYVDEDGYIEEGHVTANHRCDLLPFDEVKLMQYTGLKDESGVEIYEGDIVRVTDDDGSTDFADGGIGTVSGMDELLMWYIDGDVHNGLYDIETTAYIEVIGNIYENPELLERERE